MTRVISPLSPGLRRARVVGRLMVSTCSQASGGPRIDSGTATDAEGRRYVVLVFGAGRRAPVLGWRTLSPPPRLLRGHQVPAVLRPAVRWLFHPRWNR